MATDEKTARRRGFRPLLAVLLAAAVGVLACGAEESGGGSGPAESETDRLVKRGRSVYQTNCIACHNNDPTLAGAIGPALAGSSLELLQAKVLRNEYPPGYVPKASSGNMIALPHLEPSLPALAAYLAEAAGS